jgi:beta-hydroxylase
MKSRRLPAAALQRLIRLHGRLISQTESGKRALFDPRAFPWVAAFERDWTSIRDEALRLLPGMDLLMNEHELLGAPPVVDRADSWKVFVLYAATQRATDNCRRCPTTARLCDTVPGLLHAFFSILKGGTHILPHRASFRGRIRYHLGLRVPGPADSTRLRVGSETLSWAAGRSFIFDDTFEHEAWNDSTEDRIVLILDFLRPLRFPFGSMNRAFTYGLMRLIAARGRPIVERWETDFGQQLDDLLRPVA